VTDPVTDPMALPVEQRFVEILDADGRTRWRVDRGFLTSRWRCIWGQGCQGIEDVAAPELHRGCCSVGARLANEEEAMTIAALGACLLPEQFQYFEQAAYHGVFEPAGSGEGGSGNAGWQNSGWQNTRVIDGACIFLNRPGWPGGMGCALHLAAQDDGVDPLDYKPGVCGRLPLRVETLPDGPQGEPSFELRAWRRDDWGPGGQTMAWWCTEADECFDAAEPVLDSLAEPLRRLVGEDTFQRLRGLL